MSSIYRLPFDPDQFPVRIIEGRNGPLKHRAYHELDDSTALSFELPVGTPVLAARGGTVMTTVDSSDFYYDGEDPEVGRRRPGMATNMVTIQHEDGTWAVYAHLGFAQVKVGEGDQVEQGQELGVTGLSGWVGPKPSLHFNVMELLGGLRSRGIPVTFENYHGPLEHNELYPPFSGKERR